jgi:hypothetical protein
MQRPKGIMEESVFEGVLTDSSGYPIDGVAITGIGEPLLDSGIIEKVKLVKKILKVPVTIYTNGTKLKSKLSDLLDAGLDSLVISLNAINGEKRKAVMGIDSWVELDDIIMNWNSKSCKLTVCVICDQGMIERYDGDAFQKRYGETVYLHSTSNWGGQYNFNLSFKPSNICPRPFEILHVNWDGNYVLCCLDYEGKVVFGKTLEEVITNKQWKYYRQMLKDGKRSELPLCGNCSTV